MSRIVDVIVKRCPKSIPRRIAEHRRQTLPFILLHFQRPIVSTAEDDGRVPKDIPIFAPARRCLRFPELGGSTDVLPQRILSAPEQHVHVANRPRIPLLRHLVEKKHVLGKMQIADLAGLSDHVVRDGGLGRIFSRPVEKSLAVFEKMFFVHGVSPVSVVV